MQKQPTYTPRELVAIRAADRVILRLHIAGEWREQEWLPLPGERIPALLARVQAEVAQATRHHRDLSRVCLYIGGDVGGERMIASVPRDYVPVTVSQECPQ